VTFKLPIKDKFFLRFLAFYFLRVRLHQSSKTKTHKEGTNRRNQGFSKFFGLIIKGTVSRSKSGSVQIMRDPVPEAENRLQDKEGTSLLGSSRFII
jgi:hypothetical protein